MKKETIFKGAATAIITPLNENGVDFDRFGKLLDWQIEEGIDALVICGTTGEGATMSQSEYEATIDYAVKRINKRVPVIAGAGSNNTSRAIEMTKYCCSVGADAILSVTPFYNKTTQLGLVKMYTEIAKASTKPVVLYNVPSRTGINIEPETYLELSKVDNISAIKEANGDLSKIIKTMSLVEDKLDVYSGNDDQAYSVMSLGGKGVISVLSNVVPKETALMCKKFFEGDYEGAKQLQFKYLNLISALFSETNPIPVKAAMAKMGFCENYLRLPLIEMSEDKKAKMFSIMKELGLI